VAQSCPIVRENLPWPVVYYPSGIFFAFAESENSPLALCSCVESAVINYFRLHADYFRPETAHLLHEIETASDELRQTWSEARPDKASLYLESDVEDLFPGHGRISYSTTHAMGASAFPHRVVKEFLSNLEDPFQTLRFESGLCHRCNLAIPSLRYTVEMYGGRFKQHYGWYIQQNAYRLGVAGTLNMGNIRPQKLFQQPDNPNRTKNYLEDACPVEFVPLLAELASAAHEASTWYTTRMADRYVAMATKYPDAWGGEKHGHFINIYRERVAEANLSDELLVPARERKREELRRLNGDDLLEPTYAEVLWERERELQSVIGKMTRQINTNLENITRKEFGFRKVGEGWISESLLHSIVQQIFPDEEILRHHRPPWLHGLELDIYLPHKRLAFEYQGQQHFHPITIWGGEPALSALRQRDLRKTEICVAENIQLIAVDYTEPLTVEHIQTVIQSGKE